MRYTGSNQTSCPVRQQIYDTALICSYLFEAALLRHCSSSEAQTAWNISVNRLKTSSTGLMNDGRWVRLMHMVYKGFLRSSLQLYCPQDTLQKRVPLTEVRQARDQGLQSDAEGTGKPFSLTNLPVSRAIMRRILQSNMYGRRYKPMIYHDVG